MWERFVGGDPAGGQGDGTVAAGMGKSGTDGVVKSFED